MIRAGQAGVPLVCVGRFGGTEVKIGASSAPLADLVAVHEKRLRGGSGLTAGRPSRAVDGRQADDSFSTAPCAVLNRRRGKCLADAMPTVSIPARSCRTGPRWLPSGKPAKGP